ncbi:hypothetical protein GCM10022267_31320 [Lentzea roselyniae]|uniref:DUF4239 domain-containing protein n=1 Tax=Lentzea roselyniae TaxID=531940 RepID=A0ABP7AWJ2_9PSEU
MVSALLVGGAILGAVLLLVLAGRRARARSGEFDIESLGFIGSVLNALFIAIVAFYIVIAWQSGDVAGSSTEAAGLVDLYWHTDAMPEQQRERVRGLIRDYTAEVADREWPAMAVGGSSQAADALLVSLHRAAATSDPAIGQAVDQNLRAITDNRRARVQQAGGDDAMLLLLLYGSFASGALMVLYPVLMGLSSGVHHVTAVVVPAASVGVVAVVELGLQHPFDGMNSVGPDAFHAAQKEFSKID